MIRLEIRYSKGGGGGGERVKRCWQNLRKLRNFRLPCHEAGPPPPFRVRISAVSKMRLTFPYPVVYAVTDTFNFIPAVTLSFNQQTLQSWHTHIYILPRTNLLAANLADRPRSSLNSSTIIIKIAITCTDLLHPTNFPSVLNFPMLSPLLAQSSIYPSDSSRVIKLHFYINPLPFPISELRIEFRTQ